MSALLHLFNPPPIPQASGRLVLRFLEPEELAAEDAARKNRDYMREKKKGYKRNAAELKVQRESQRKRRASNTGEIG